MVEVSHYNQSGKGSLSDILENDVCLLFLTATKKKHKFVSHKWLAAHVADTLNSTSTVMAILLMSPVFNSKHGYG